ncbi:MAG: hypothetical protein JJE15_10220 [Desulfobacteraceae bacterium]|nr:hypothetical protein [Desulfobacteraceae bacterium]
MKKLLACCLVMLFIFSVSAIALGATQEKYALPEPYLGWEKAYLQAFPQIQGVMDEMIQTTIRQKKKPDQDILHNRVCSAIVYWMATQEKLSRNEQKVAVIGDILHNISKAEKKLALTDPDVLRQCTQIVKDLRESGYFKTSPEFWSDTSIFQNPKIGKKYGLIHHITGALMATQIVRKTGGFTKKDIQELQVAILEHSTGYWYFRDMIDAAAGRKGAWKVVFPEPETQIAKFAHDADLISQFVPESVIPDGSKWRGLAKKRWGAKNTKEEGQIVYYVFFRLFEEAKTEVGKQMATEKWNIIKPELMKLMGLAPGQDPVKVLGVPAIFQEK